MSFWNSMRISATALSAQRMRLDLISNNIANAQTTKTEDGGPYKRQDLVLQAKDNQPFLPSFVAARQKTSSQYTPEMGGVEVTEIISNQEEGPRVYDPNHPDADEDGYVTYPNVNLVVEMTNMLSATRSYEASLSVIEASKHMALKALDIGG